jgi:hypothetical protein
MTMLIEAELAFTKLGYVEIHFNASNVTHILGRLM